MTEIAPYLQAYPEPVLSRLASVVAGRPVRVSVNGRLDASAVIVRQGLSLHFHPLETGPFDVLLLAAITPRLAKRTGAPTEAWVAKEANQARARILERFPGARAWPGKFRHEGHPLVRQDELPITPLSEDGEGLSGAGMQLHGGLNVRGAEEDLARVLEAIRRGKLPTITLPELPHPKVAEIPLSFAACTHDAEVDAWVSDTKDRLGDSIDNVVSCRQKKEEGIIEWLNTRRPQSTGRRLDPGRLTLIPLSRKTNDPVNAFRGRRRRIQGRFKPEQHLDVVSIDTSRQPLYSMRVSETIVPLFLESSERLGVETAAVAFSDRSTDDIYLRCSGILKTPEEKLDGRVYARLFHLNQSQATTSCWATQVRALESWLPQLVRPEHRKVQIMMAGYGAMWSGDSSDEAIENMVAIGQERLRRLQRVLGIEVDIFGIYARALTRHMSPKIRDAFKAFG